MDSFIIAILGLAFQISLVLMSVAFKVFFVLVQLFVKLLVLLLNLAREQCGARRTQVLAPGDRLSPHRLPEDLHDYRSLASLSELRPTLGTGIVPLGRYLSARGHTQDPLGLPDTFLQQHVVVIGPSGAGKSSNLMEPWAMELLRQGSSVVMVDVKGELMATLGDRARQSGYRVCYWDSSQPERSDRWNWLAEIEQPRDVEAAVESILGRPKPNDPQPFFKDRDYRWLRTLITVVTTVYGKQALPSDLNRLVADQSVLRRLFEQNPLIYSHLNDLLDLLQFSTDEHSRAVSGLLNALHLFNLPQVRQISEAHSFNLRELDQQPTLLIIGASLADARTAETLSSLMLSQLFNQVYRRFERGVTGNLRPWYFLLDEAASIKDRVDLGKVLSVARSAQVGICLALQDVSQLGTEPEALPVLSNCHTAIVLRGCSAATAQYFASRLGQRHAQMVQINRQRGPFDVLGQRGHQIQNTLMPVLSDREIMHIPFRHYCAVVHVRDASAKPFLVDFTR